MNFLRKRAWGKENFEGGIMPTGQAYGKELRLQVRGRRKYKGKLTALHPGKKKER